MAGFPAPSVGRDHFSELLYLIKNTEYENSQQLQSIEQEREKIARLRTELEDKLRDSEQRERSGRAAEEQKEGKEKKLVYLKENCDSLKHTALVLEEHQAALRKKLQLKQEDYQAKREHHSELLLKYRGTWERYEAKYQARPLAMEVAQRRKTVEDTRKEVQDQSDEIAGLEKQIASLKLVNGQEPPAEVAQWKCPSQIVSEIAEVFVKRDRACFQFEQKTSLLDQLNADISALEDKVKKQQQQKERDKVTQQKGAGRPPDTAPSVPSESLTADPQTLSAAEGGSKVVSGPAQQHAQPPPVRYTPVLLQRPLQRPAPPSRPFDQHSRPSVPLARAPTRPASLFTLPSLISPVQPQRQHSVPLSASRGLTFTPNTATSRPPPSLASRPPQRFPVSNFQLVTPPLPKAPPPSGRGGTPMQQRPKPPPTPVIQPITPSPPLEVSVFKCPKPVTRAPPRGMEAPFGTPGEPATNQVDLYRDQQMRKEGELEAVAEVVVTEQPSVPAGDSSEVVEAVSEAAVNTIQQVGALDSAPPQPPPEENEHESFMDFTAATTGGQHKGKEGGMASSLFNFGFSPEVQTQQQQQQQQVLSPSQSTTNPEGFTLCPSNVGGPLDAAGEEGSGMAFLFGEGSGGETGGEGGVGLFQFEGTSSSQEHGTPVDSGPSWSLFGGGGTQSGSQGDSFSFAFGGSSPQTPQSEGSNNTMSMFQF